MPETVVIKTRDFIVIDETYTEKDIIESSLLIKALEKKVKEDIKIRERYLPCIYSPSTEHKQSES